MPDINPITPVGPALPGSLPSGYYPALNGVRAVAVMLVVLGHWVQPLFPMGSAGTTTFFVISGYLISGIAWEHKLYEGPVRRWQKPLLTFYARRALRILPAYYVALALGALLPLATLRAYPAWFLLPVSNVLFYHLGHWGEGVGHFWTLAVDEQFYLLWPALLAALGRRGAALLALAAAGVLFRIGWSIHHGADFTLILFPSSLDLFAIGALLKLLEQRPSLQRLARGPWAGLAWATWAGVWLAAYYTNHQEWWLLIYPTIGGGAAFLTLNWVLNLPIYSKHPGLLLHPAVQWLGQHSYGCYLYHLMLPVLYQRIVYHLFTNDAVRTNLLGPLPTVLVLTPVLLTLAAASWRWLEAPLDRFKHRLSYTSVRVTP